jgi:hypothetical protein
MYTVQTLNKEAKKYNLKLVRGEGYFYWLGLTEEVQKKINDAESGNSAVETSVYVFRFTHLSEENWNRELETIKKIIL